MATPADYKNIKEQMNKWFLAIKSRLLMIVIKSVIVSLACSLLIGFTCWALGDFNIRYYRSGALVGVPYLLFAIMECGDAKRQQWNEPSTAMIKLNKMDLFFEKHWLIFFSPLYVGVFYMFLSSYERMGGFFGYWVAMAFFFCFVIFFNFHYLAVRRKAREIRAGSQAQGDNSICK